MAYRIKEFLQSNSKLSLAITFLWTVLFYLLIGLEWDFYDGFVTNFPSGYLTGEPYGDFYIYGFALMSYLFAFLHSIIQPVPWFGVFSLCFFLAATTVVTNNFLNILSGWIQKRWPLYLIGSVLFLLLFVSSLTGLSLTGISFLCCGSALIGIHSLKRYSRENTITYIGLLVIYAWGFLMRFESGLGASLIVGAFVVLTTNTFKQTLKILVLPAVIAASSLLYIQHIAQSVPFLYNTEAAMVYVADGVNAADFYTGKSPKDSIKSRAIKGFYMNDEAELTEDFINNLSKEKARVLGNVEVSFVEKIHKAWTISLPCIKADLSSCLFNVFLVLIVLWLYAKGNSSVYFYLRIFFFQVLFWLIILSVAYWVKMEYRHFDPMMQLYTICNLLFLFLQISLRPNKFSMRQMRLSLLLVVVLLGFKLQGAVQKSSETKQVLQTQRKAVEEVNKLAAGKILLLDVNSRQIVHGNVFSVVKFPSVQKILFYDMGELPIIPTYKKILDEACDCNSSRMKDFYSYLYKNRKDVVVVSVDGRVNLISGYLQLVHGVNYRFKKMEGEYQVNNVVSTGGKLSYYVIQ